MQKNETLKLKNLVNFLDNWAPFAWQESYDNSGLILGDPEQEIRKALVCFDFRMEIVEEAIEKNAQAIISHHPPIFKGIKRIDPRTPLGNMIRLSLCNNISWIALHTNLDNVSHGVNAYLSDRLNLKESRALVPLKGLFGKLETYVPISRSEELRQALFEEGCGKYRHYDCCSWKTQGEGCFRPLDGAQPYSGRTGDLQYEPEIILEMIYPIHKTRTVVECLRRHHPYEEPAFHLIPLENSWNDAGTGLIGNLPDPLSEKELLDKLKALTQSACIRHSGFRNRKIRTVALCGGSGGGFIADARSQNADVYITGDLKYHDFADATPSTWLVDIGHFESEQFAKQLIYEHIRKNFPNFAVLISERSVNPVFCY